MIPIGDRILIKPTKPEEKSKGGIILKKLEEEKQDTGTVLAVGDGEQVKRFKKGDKLIFLRYGPAYVFQDKEKLVIAHIDEILAINN